MSVDVLKPSASLRAPFLAMLDDYDAHDPENGEFYADARLDFDTYIRSLLDEERGVDLPEGYVPCSHRWLLDTAGDVVGIARVRHNIDTPFLAEEAGHIGYDVPPAHRGQRYGIVTLRAALAEAQRLGLERVLLCCDADNLCVVAHYRSVRRSTGARVPLAALRMPGAPLLDRDSVRPRLTVHWPNKRIKLARQSDAARWSRGARSLSAVRWADDG